MSTTPEVALSVALLALAGVLFTALVAIMNARKRGELDAKLLEIKANLDKLNTLELTKVQAEHSAKLKALEQERTSQAAADDRRRSVDASTLTSILAVLGPDNVIAFLRNHDFAGIYDREEGEPLLRFLELSRRPDSEFLNPELEQLRESLVALGARLAKLLALKTHPRQGTFSSVLPENMVNEIRPAWIDANAEEINDCATAFVDAFEKLVRHARKAHVG